MKNHSLEIKDDPANVFCINQNIKPNKQKSSS